MKKYFLLIMLCVSGFAIGQNVNDYQYAVVPLKFPFQKEDNQYRLNALTKLYMEKYGFITYFEKDLPDDIANRRCNLLYVDLDEKSNMFTTSISVQLKDCKGNIIYTSGQGKSKDKEYKTAYNEALREAFKSFDELGYKYNGSITDVETSIVRTTNNGTSVTKEVIPVKPVTNTPAVSENTENLLSAQPIKNGFQLVDTTPKVVLRIFNTTVNSVFLAEKEQVKGVVFNKSGVWVFEYYNEGNLVSEALNIRF